MTSFPPTTPGPISGGAQPHRGVLILVLGIVALVIGCGPLGIVAWIMGNGDLKRIKAGQLDPEGRGLTLGGMICGIISTVLFALGLLYIFVVMVLMGGLAAAGAAGAGGP